MVYPQGKGPANELFRFSWITTVYLGDCFSRFVISFLATQQSGPLGREFNGETEIPYYLQSRKGKVGGNYSVLYSVACSFLCTALQAVFSTRYNCKNFPL